MENNDQKAGKGCAVAISVIITAVIFIGAFASRPETAADLGGILLSAGGFLGGYLIYKAIKMKSGSGWGVIGALLVGLAVIGIAMALSENSEITIPIGLISGLIISCYIGSCIYQSMKD